MIFNLYKSKLFIRYYAVAYRIAHNAFFLSGLPALRMVRRRKCEQQRRFLGEGSPLRSPWTEDVGAYSRSGSGEGLLSSFFTPQDSNLVDNPRVLSARSCGLLGPLVAGRNPSSNSGRHSCPRFLTWTPYCEAIGKIFKTLKWLRMPRNDVEFKMLKIARELSIK